MLSKFLASDTSLTPASLLFTLFPQDLYSLTSSLCSIPTKNRLSNESTIPPKTPGNFVFLYEGPCEYTLSMRALIFLLPNRNPNPAEFELEVPAKEPTGSISTNRVNTGFHTSHCGYCKGYGSRTFGIYAYSMTCEDYQDLINRGWRRSGQYVYKPNLRDSCCPQYTIRLNALKFQLSKSQRKLIIKYNRYIEGSFLPSSIQGGELELKTSDQEQTPTIKTNKKAKPKPFVLSEAIHESEERADWKHRLKIVLEQSSFTEEKFKLYCKYQTNIHGDAPDQNTESGFTQFLVDSPLIFESSNTNNNPGYGSFHQLYYLDEKLIAVAVLDILPRCLSSVYFFYDPDYSFLGLGKYSALREISMTKELHEAGYGKMEWYYMGFYIHSCPKMKYKGQYQPSELLDAETYEWFPYDQCVPLLDMQKYVEFSNSNMVDQCLEEPTSSSRNKNNPKNDNKSKKSNHPPGMRNPEEITDKELQLARISVNGTIKTIEKDHNQMDSLREYVAAAYGFFTLGRLWAKGTLKPIYILQNHGLLNQLIIKND
ncbi:hypothetical protein G9A89_021577 [Geosiphon pyriformis]|nr:hypothetical protein G9A89_021577 [Geosiphon pyriformis]